MICHYGKDNLAGLGPPLQEYNVSKCKVLQPNSGLALCLYGRMRTL